MIDSYRSFGFDRLALCFSLKDGFIQDICLVMHDEEHWQSNIFGTLESALQYLASTLDLILLDWDEESVFLIHRKGQAADYLYSVFS